MTGENLVSERLYCRIECPKRAPPQVQAADRFGTLAVVLGQPKPVCTSVTLDTEAP